MGAAFIFTCIAAALPMPAKLLGLGTRIRDQGRAPLGGNFAAGCGKSARRRMNQLAARLKSRTRKTITTITISVKNPLPPDAPGVRFPVLPPMGAGAPVGLATSVCSIAVGVAVAVGGGGAVGLGGGVGPRVGVSVVVADGIGLVARV